MENSQSTVIPIRKTDNQSSASKTQDNRVLIDSAAKLLKSYLQETFAVHLEQIEQQMYDASDAGDNDSIALDIKVLQKASSYLSSLYTDSVVKNLMSFSGKQKNTGKTFFSSQEVDDWSELKLLATDEIENQLLIDGYIANCESQLSDMLYALKCRVEFVSSTKELKNSKNPFGPSILMNTYVELIKGESFSKEAHKTLCESFSQAVLSDLGDVLEEINEVFLQANILPKLPKLKPAVNKSNSLANKETKPFVNEKAARITPDQFQPIETNASEQLPTQAPTFSVANIEPAVYSGLVEMAQAYRNIDGGKVISDGLVVEGKQFPTIDLIETLSELQKESATEGVDVNESVRLQIGSRIQVDGQRQPYAEQDETLIDVVAMFFDVILQDRHLPDTVRAMIAQLQIPILKVAMMDKEFFAKKSHPGVFSMHSHRQV